MSTALLPRDTVLCLAEDEADRLVQLAAVLAVQRPRAVAGRRRPRWPSACRPRCASSVALAQDWSSGTVHFDAVLHHGDAAARLALCRRIAERAGPIVGVVALEPGSATSRWSGW